MSHPVETFLRTRLWLVLCAVLASAPGGDAQPSARRRALLIGINDYTASRLGTPRQKTNTRDWPNLGGTINDVTALREMLIGLYGFQPDDIVTLTDQEATRAAILRTIDRHLVETAAKGDTLFYYFAGHGSQVPNSRSDEHDQLDESFVPADSRVGAPDIRDKELRPRFSRVLDRGALLTVILDSCHSASGIRGLPSGARPRGIRPDTRDVADGTKAGPTPDSRGALVISAAQDFDEAWETRDDQGQIRGAFTWAWMRALRDAASGESALETFLRARARLRGEKPHQVPVLEGSSVARSRPFLGSRIDQRGERVVIGIEDVRDDGTVLLHGGWANGLSVGCEVRVSNAAHVTTARLRVTALHGMTRSEARIAPPGTTLPQAVRPGELVEVVAWAAPPPRPLRVWAPTVSGDVDALAARLYVEAVQRGIHWVTEPIETTTTHVLRYTQTGWEILTTHAEPRVIGPEAGDAIAALERVPLGSSLFVQFPAPARIVDGIAIGPGTDGEGIEPVTGAEDADYVLVGRFANRRLSYAWMRPTAERSDRRESGLPLCTKWVDEDGRDGTIRDSVGALRNAVVALRKILGWHLLESPPGSRYPYRLALRRLRNGEWAKDSAVIGEEDYGLVLRAASTPLPPRVTPRYVYAFNIDNHGRSVLLFPRKGSVENRFPAAPPPVEIDLGKSAEFTISPPYGVDTYFLLTTDEPLANPWILEWNGVRAVEPASSLERLLMITAAGDRATPPPTPATWSIEKVFLESVPPRAGPKSAN